MTLLPAVLSEYNVLVWACALCKAKSVRLWFVCVSCVKAAGKREQCARARALQVRVGR